MYNKATDRGVLPVLLLAEVGVELYDVEFGDGFDDPFFDVDVVGSILPIEKNIIMQQNFHENSIKQVNMKFKI